MKNTIFYLAFAIVLAACNASPQAKGVTPRPAFVSTTAPKTAPNVTVSKYGVVAFYPDADVQISLQFSQRVIVEKGATVGCYAADVWQERPGVFVAETGSQVIRLNTNTGRTEIKSGATFDVVYQPTQYE